MTVAQGGKGFEAPQAGDVHLWLAEFDDLIGALPHLEDALSAGEIARAIRFHREIDRRRYMAGRGALRHILSAYLEEAPSKLCFECGPYGKPSLPSGAPIQFNLSHSGRFAILAVTSGREVGVDIEEVARAGDLEKLAHHFFSPREIASLRSLPAEQRAEAFFACWTRKEAFIKAIGDGLAMPLDAFDVALEPGRPAALLDVRWRDEDVSDWSMIDVSPGHGYKAAVVVRGTVGRIARRRFGAENLA